jgi:hypothetical protein
MKMEHGQANRDSYYLPESAWQKGRNILVGMAALGWILSIAGLFVDRQQFFFSYLAAFFYFLVITAGSLFFVKVQYLTGSVWSVTVRRLMENISVGMVWAALLFIPIIFGIGDLYQWSHPNIVKADEIMEGRATYFGYPFFFARVIAYFAIWCFFSLRIYRRSVDMDRSGSVLNILKAESLSAPGLLLLFLTVSLAADDWIMSLQPHWYSTMWGVYCLAGGALALMSAMTLISIGLRKNGYLTNTITVEHLHDLGKWMFALTVFWTYIAFSQYMLIWYANLPEETIFFYNRMQGSWLYISLLLVFGHFIFPFFLLLARGAKRSLPILTLAATWLVFICYVDVYWMVMPVLHPQGIAPHWLDLTTLLAVGGTFAFGFWLRLRKTAMIPVGDVRLERSLAFKNM